MPNTKPKPFAKLNNKQRLFVAEYCKDFNGTQAAIRCGYSIKAAKQQAVTLVANPTIALEIQKRMASRETLVDCSAEKVIEELGVIAFHDPGSWLKRDADGKILDDPEVDWRSLQPSQTKLITEFRLSARTGKLVGVKLASKVGALELLGKYHKLFTDKVEHDVSSDLLDRLTAGRTRLNEQKPAIDVQRDQEQ